MSTVAWSPHPLLISPRVRWNEVAPGLRVGTRDGEYLGFIESTAYGTFVAFDHYSTPVGRYDSLREARRALVEVKRMGTRRSHASAEPMARRLATSTGLVAATLLLCAGALYLTG